MQHAHLNIQHLQLAEGGPNILSAYRSVIFLSRRLVCYESGDLKICDIGVDICKGMLCCLLLTTVNCGEQFLCFQDISRVLACRFGWAGSSGLRWISLVQKEPCFTILQIYSTVAQTFWIYAPLPEFSSFLFYSRVGITQWLPLHFPFQPYEQR